MINKLQILLKMLSKTLLWGGVITVTIYLSACLFLVFQQSRFIFFPYRPINTTPEFFNLDYEDIWIPVQTQAGKVERIHGWWIPAKSQPQRVLLYLHGNGSNVGGNIAHASRFHQLGFSVLLIDYRGYGQSEGSFPTQAQVYQDAAAAWDYLVSTIQIQPSQILIYGHSLGGAVAINLGVQQPQAAGLIVESSFTSIREIVTQQRQYAIFPVDLLLHQRFDSLQKVPLLQIPVLFIHGTADTTVPVVMSQQLYAAAREPKQLLLVPNAEHNNVADVAGSKYLQAVQKFGQLVEQQ